MHSQPGGTPPVFMDRTGRRRRLSIVAGTAMGLGLLVSLGLIVAGIFTVSPVSAPGWSDSGTSAPMEAGVDGLGDSPTSGSSPAPLPVTRIPATVPPPATTTRTTAAPAGAQPTDRPGQGDERRNAGKPSKSPGKPR